ncbi:anti-sigma factor [Bacillaceae bacterium]
MQDEKVIENEKDALTSLLKKARRKTILRNVGISLLISLLVLGGGGLGILQLLSKSGDDALRDVWMFKNISGPNLYVGGYRQDFGLLNGTLEYRTYKIIEGIPIMWNEETVAFNLFGHFSRMPGDYSSIQIPDPAMEREKFHYQRHYNPQNGQREMMFYLPDIDYGHYLNDIPSLNEMDEDKLVEMAISFDKNYTVKQIQAMLPEGVHPVWYWVDTYYDKELYKPQKTFVEQKMPDGTVKKVEKVTPPLPESARFVYGFGVSPEGGDATEKTFLSYIESGLKVKGKYYDEYKKIYDYLRKEKEKPVESDVKIIGVVVTGTAESLKALKGKNYVKAAVLGAIVDKY